MNNMKAYAAANKCMHLITFADNQAVGYFEKQVSVSVWRMVCEGVCFIVWETVLFLCVCESVINAWHCI